jgi:hypothetical protein
MFAVINTTTVKQAQRKAADMFAPVAFINVRPQHDNRSASLEISQK